MPEAGHPGDAYRAMFDLTGRNAVVLGAGSGIGAASAAALAALGAIVICADLDGDMAAKTAAEIGSPLQSHACDAGSAKDVAALAQAAGRHGRIDIAVTTPGLNIRKRILEYTEDDFAAVVNLNLRGTFLFFRAFGGIMVDQGGGSIIACSSIRATTIEPGLAVYGMTKAGIGTLVKGFAAEVGHANVRVNAIAPSVIETALTAPIKERRAIYDIYAAHTVLQRWGQTSEVGGAVAFLASDAASYITGSTLLVDGGWTAVDGPPTGLTHTRPS